jgi:hypothetical protein
MKLNTRSPKYAEERKKKRQLLEAETLETIRRDLRYELSDIAPTEWTQETVDELVEGKIAESQRIIDALTVSELEDAFGMQRHCEWVVVELRMVVHRRIREERFMPGSQ